MNEKLKEKVDKDMTYEEIEEEIAVLNDELKKLKRIDEIEKQEAQPKEVET